MKNFLIFLLLLGAVGGGVYYYNPELLGLESKTKVVKKKKTAKPSAKKKAAPEVIIAEEAPKDEPAPAVEDTPQPTPVEEPQKAEETPETDLPDVDSPKEVVQLYTPDDEVEAAKRAARPLNFPENLQARAKAKESGRPCLILWYGSDWMPYSAKLAAQWSKLSKKGLPVVFGQINEKVGTVPDFYERGRLLPIGEFNALPVAVLMGPDETLLGVYTGKIVFSAAAMAKAVTSTLKTMPEYMKLVEKARTANGVEGATAAAQALAMLPHETAMRNRELKDIINKKDPNHQTVFRYLYCMDHIAMYGELNAMLAGGKGADGVLQGASRKFAETMAFVNKVLATPGLSIELQQQWNSALAYVVREMYKATKEPALRKQLVEHYNRVVSLDPESEYGKGAARWAHYWDDSRPYVFKQPYYDSGDMTVDFEKEWHVDVTSQMDGPGKYTFSLEPLPSKNGRLTSRGFQLFANGKLVCEADVPADRDTKSVTFDVPRALKENVEVRFRVQCFDGWYGCAGEMVMKKQK